MNLHTRRLILSITALVITASVLLTVAAKDDALKEDPQTTAQSTLGLCDLVGNGAVGESGESSQAYHQVTGETEIIMVARASGSNLCPNHTAVAVLLVNGKLADAGVISDAKSIQANAKPDDQIAVALQSIPLFNGVECIVLGELKYRLEQCLLE